MAIRKFFGAIDMYSGAGLRLRPSDSVFRSGPPIKSVLYWLRRHNGEVNEQMLEDLYYTDGPKG